MNEVHILLIEDNDGDVLLTREAFKEGRIKNRLSVAKDGQEALEFLNTANSLPDLILLDINLPKINGLEVLMTIKNNDRLRRIPVIILSTSGAQNDILTSYNNHANCFITKPVDFNRFMDVVRTIEDFWVSIVKLPKN